MHVVKEFIQGPNPEVRHTFEEEVDMRSESKTDKSEMIRNLKPYKSRMKDDVGDMSDLWCQR